VFFCFSGAWAFVISSASGEAHLVLYGEQYNLVALSSDLPRQAALLKDMKKSISSLPCKSFT
jgi:hypothetical protein